MSVLFRLKLKRDDLPRLGDSGQPLHSTRMTNDGGGTRCVLLIAFDSFICRSFIYTISSYVLPSIRPFFQPANPLKLHLQFMLTSLLFAGINNNATRNLTRLHLLKDALKLRKTHNFEWSLNKTSRKEVNRLSGITSVTDVRTLDGDHLDNSIKDWSLQERTSWETNSNDRSAWTNILGGLLEWLLEWSEQQDSVWTESVLGIGLDLLHEVLAVLEVDVLICAKLLTHIRLLVSAVDGKDVETHGLGVLASKGTESTTGADDGDGLAWTGAGLLESLVDGDTGAENWGHGGEVNVLWNAGYVGGFADGVLLEGTVDGVAGEDGLWAEWLCCLLDIDYGRSTE